MRARTRLTRAACARAGVLLLWVLPWHATAAARLADYASGQPLPAADIQELAASLRDAPGPLRADFALVAISELVEVYQREADRARTELRRQAPDRDLARWVRSVEDMVAGLQRLADSLSPDTPVAVDTPRGDTVYLVVDGIPVLLSGPRPADNAALESRVLQRFCSRNDCSELLESDDAPITRAPENAASEAPVWRFGDAAGPVCATGDGLEFQFEDAADLGAKREACRRVVAELNVLAQALAGASGKGVALEWNRLAIVSSGSDGLQVVGLNGGGDTLRLPLPSLAQAPQLVRLVLPWLAAKVDGRRYNLVVLHSGRLLNLPVRPGD